MPNPRAHSSQQEEALQQPTSAEAKAYCKPQHQQQLKNTNLTMFSQMLTMLAFGASLSYA